jgi:hypothetical protein
MRRLRGRDLFDLRDAFRELGLAAISSWSATTALGASSEFESQKGVGDAASARSTRSSCCRVLKVPVESTSINPKFDVLLKRVCAILTSETQSLLSFLQTRRANSFLVPQSLLLRR